MKKPVVFDIGANLRNHSLAYSTVAKAVYSFEPVPELFDLLNQNISQNGIPNINAFPLAISNACGEKFLFVNSKSNLGASGFYKRDSSTHHISVKTVTGDHFVEDMEISQLDFIKMDIEGHEQFALEGLLGAVERFKPLLQIEWTFPDKVKEIS